MKFLSLQLPAIIACLTSYVFCTTTTQNASYDDLIGTTGVETAVGTYKGLKYNAWVIAIPTTGSVAIGGLADSSPPNSALTAADTQLTNGTPTFTIASPYKSFSPLDFFFGCDVRDDISTVGLATQCTCTVAGFIASKDQEVALASFTFTPPLKPLTPVPMIHAVLPSSFLQALNNVTMIVDNKAAALRIDNFRYNLVK